MTNLTHHDVEYGVIPATKDNHDMVWYGDNATSYYSFRQVTVTLQEQVEISDGCSTRTAWRTEQGLFVIMSAIPKYRQTRTLVAGLIVTLRGTKHFPCYYWELIETMED